VVRGLCQSIRYVFIIRVSILLTIVICALSGTAWGSDDLSDWTIFLTNDNCPDYTWGYTEQQTRHAFAEIVRSHLDLMKQTDGESPENRDRYNMAVTQEAICFLEYYPDREAELISRISDKGRPYICQPISLQFLMGISKLRRCDPDILSRPSAGRQMGN
jgi:hypothetical protein